jgi:phosphate:Na+ symporter
MGFAVLMFGMSAMSGAVSGLGKEPWFTDTLASLSNPLLGILVGAVFTAILQSASAAVGIVQALSVTGAMQFDAALPLLMGIAIGAAFPVLLSALGANVDGKRTAVVYPVAAAVSVVICAALFYIANAIFRFDFLQMVMDPFSLALVNTILRLAMVLLLLPFVDVLETLVRMLVREKEAEPDTVTVRLEERFLAHPALAVEQSRLTINDMAECCRQALASALALTANYSKEGFEEVKKLEDEADRYEDALGTYLVKLTGREMSRRQNEDVSKYLHTITDFERISDHALNIAESAAEIHDKKIDFSDDATRELSVLSAAVREIVRMTTEAFEKEDLSLAMRVEPLEELIDRLSEKAKYNHVDRLQRGVCTIRQGFVFNDVLTSIERVSDHCSNIALAMLQLADDAFDTHEGQRHLMGDDPQAFQSVLDEYAARFAF